MNIIKTKFKSEIFVLALLGAMSSSIFAQSTIDERAKDLISKMTVEEKIGMIVGDGKFLNVDDPKTIEEGKGIIINDQRSKLVIPRLAIRTTAMADGPARLNRESPKGGQKHFQYTTAFPTATCIPCRCQTSCCRKRCGILKILLPFFR